MTDFSNKRLQILRDSKKDEGVGGLSFSSSQPDGTENHDQGDHDNEEDKENQEKSPQEKSDFLKQKFHVHWFSFTDHKRKSSFSTLP